MGDGGADGATAFGVGKAGQGAGPGNVAVAGGVQTIPALTKTPFAAVVGLAQGEVIGGDIVFTSGKAFFGHGELVHEGKAEVMFFGGEVDLDETAAEMFGGFPADLAAQAGLIAGGLNAGQALQEIEQDGFEKMPIFCAAGEQGAKGEDVALRFVDHYGKNTEKYPLNPNGSPAGVTGLTTPDGRFTIVMPHPERVFRTVQMSWSPDQAGEDSPWMQMFYNARAWVG